MQKGFFYEIGTALEAGKYLTYWTVSVFEKLKPTKLALKGLFELPIDLV